MEIAALKIELEKAGAATGTKEQLGSDGNGTRIEANSQNVNSEIREIEKPEEGCDISYVLIKALYESANSP